MLLVEGYGTLTANVYATTIKSTQCVCVCGYSDFFSISHKHTYSYIFLNSYKNANTVICLNKILQWI